jgi:hypothetical protein
VPTGTATQLLPQQHFGQAHLASQLTRALHLFDRCSKNLGIDPAWAPSTVRLRRPVPLPVPGRITQAGNRANPRCVTRSTHSRYST